MPFARGRMRAENPKTMAIHTLISKNKLSSPRDKTQNMMGLAKCPAMRMVAHAGPSSARNGS